jgi:hypothetical protein
VDFTAKRMKKTLVSIVESLPPKLKLVHPSAFHKERFGSAVSPPSHKIASASHNIVLFVPIVEGEYTDIFTVIQPSIFG